MASIHVRRMIALGTRSALTLCAASIVGADHGDQVHQPSSTTTSSVTKTPPPPHPSDAFSFKVTEGTGLGVDRPGTVAGHAPVDQAEPEKEVLDEASTRRLLKRLPDLVVEPGDKTTFSLRKSSPPAPRTGQTLKTSFPPETTEDRPEVSVKQEPLRILRAAPQGDVELAPRISITFSQPMIELTSHDESVAEGVPVEMTPKLDGQWRWLGTETLVFEMSPRLPMATEYSVVVPAGTRSLSGNILESEYRFSFRTPPPKVLHWAPSDSPQNLEPTLSIQFNQAIDIESVLKKVRVNAGGTDFAVEPS